jgi:hypothetical protein
MDCIVGIRVRTLERRGMAGYVVAWGKGERGGDDCSEGWEGSRIWVDTAT